MKKAILVLSISAFVFAQNPKSTPLTDAETASFQTAQKDAACADSAGNQVMIEALKKEISRLTVENAQLKANITWHEACDRAGVGSDTCSIDIAAKQIVELAPKSAPAQ